MCSVIFRIAVTLGLEAKLLLLAENDAFFLTKVENVTNILYWQYCEMLGSF
jgi:hypothetical protein